MVLTDEPSKAQGRALIGLTGVFIALPFPFVALRIWARRLSGVRLTINDYLILIALLFATGLGIDIIIGSVRIGYLSEGDGTTPSDVIAFDKAVFAATVLWPTANAAVKFAFLHFYYTIFACNRTTQIAIFFVAFVTLGYWLGAVITAFALCTPFAYNWNKELDAHCGNVVASYLAVAIVNLLSDVMIIALPMPMVWSLQTRTSRKVALTFIFGLGIVICALSVARCVAIVRLTASQSSRWEILDDVTTVMEPTLGIINSCLPILGPVSRKLFHGGSKTESQSPLKDKASENTGSSHDDMKSERKRPGHNTLTTSLRRDSFDDADLPVEDGVGQRSV